MSALKRQIRFDLGAGPSKRARNGSISEHDYNDSSSDDGSYSDNISSCKPKTAAEASMPNGLSPLKSVVGRVATPIHGKDDTPVVVEKNTGIISTPGDFHLSRVQLPCHDKIYFHNGKAILAVCPNETSAMKIAVYPWTTRELLRFVRGEGSADSGFYHPDALTIQMNKGKGATSLDIKLLRFRTIGDGSPGMPIVLEVCVKYHDDSGRELSNAERFSLRAVAEAALLAQGCRPRIEVALCCNDCGHTYGARLPPGVHYEDSFLASCPRLDTSSHLKWVANKSPVFAESPYGGVVPAARWNVLIVDDPPVKVLGARRVIGDDPPAVVAASGDCSYITAATAGSDRPLFSPRPRDPRLSGVSPAVF